MTNSILQVPLENTDNGSNESSMEDIDQNTGDSDLSVIINQSK